MPFVNATLLAYGILCILFGAYGTYKAPNHEIFSLVGGLVAGMLVIGSVAWAKTNPRAGRILALVVSLAMFGKFMRNDHMTGKILAVLSIAVAVILLGAHFVAMRARRVASGD